MVSKAFAQIARLPLWAKLVWGVVSAFYTLLGIPATGEDIARYGSITKWLREHLVGSQLIVALVVVALIVLVVAHVYVAVQLHSQSHAPPEPAAPAQNATRSGPALQPPAPEEHAKRLTVHSPYEIHGLSHHPRPDGGFRRMRLFGFRVENPVQVGTEVANVRNLCARFTVKTPGIVIGGPAPRQHLWEWEGTWHELPPWKHGDSVTPDRFQPSARTAVDLPAGGEPANLLGLALLEDSVGDWMPYPWTSGGFKQDEPIVGHAAFVVRIVLWGEGLTAEEHSHEFTIPGASREGI
jgi:hypothetical protein